MFLAAALACQGVTRFVETVSCVTIAGAADGCTPPMAGADLFLNGVTVPPHLAEVILALAGVSSGGGEGANALSRAEIDTESLFLLTTILIDC